ncbi:helix-turn-helix domain-containing protein [Leptospira jelokensis]|nr:helix-turn-helix domain-containing protein [Leptospira jelokensis]
MGVRSNMKRISPLLKILIFSIGLILTFNTAIVAEKLAPELWRTEYHILKPNDPSDLSNLKSLDWIPFQGSLAFGFESQKVLVRVSYLGQTDKWEHSALYLENPVAYVDSITVFQWEEGKLFRMQDGDIYPKRKSIFSQHPYPLFSLDINSLKQNKEFYILYESLSNLFISPEIYDEGSILSEVFGVRDLFFIYFGIILIVFILNAILFGLTRNSSFLYYMLYVFTSFLYQLSFTGYAKIFLWPNSGKWNDQSMVFFGSIALVSVALFSIRFLVLQKRIPIVYQGIRIFIYLILTNAVISLVIRSIWNDPIVHVLGIITSLMLFGSGIYLLLKKLEIARFYVLAWTILLISILCFNFYALGILPDSILFRHAIQLGTIAEMLLFQFAIVDRLMKPKEETIITVEKESKQNSRTQRISNLNQDDLIYQINHILSEEKLFCDEDLNVNRLSTILGIRSDQTSALLNQKLGVSFNQLLSKYRIEEACKILKEDPSQNILTVAFAVGFNTKSAFYESFQKIVGKTPTEYKKSLNS